MMSEDAITNLQRRVADLERQRDQSATRVYGSGGSGPAVAGGYGGAGGFSAAAMDFKSQAAATQATEHLYAPLRSDTKAVIDLAAFARRLLNPDDLGHAVTKEVRDCARRALGMPEVKEYDL